MYIYCFGSFNSNSLLIAHSKQCVPTRKTRGIIKIKRFAQRLTNRACTGDERRVLTYCFISYMINFLGGGGAGVEVFKLDLDKLGPVRTCAGARCLKALT